MPNGLELSRSAAQASLPSILAHLGGPGALTFRPASRVGFSEVLGVSTHSRSKGDDLTRTCLRLDDVAHSAHDAHLDTLT